MKRTTLMSLVVLLSASTLSPAHAAVRITTQDGTVVTGDILSLQNGNYTVKTAYGQVVIPSTSVISIKSDIETAPSAPPSGALQLAGSTTVGDELAPTLLEAFAASLGATDVTQVAGQTQADVDVVGKGPQGQTMNAHVSRLGTGTAFEALAKHTADIGMASRRITQQEAARLASLSMGDFTQPGLENVLALDGLIIVVNKANPIDSLSLAQMRDIFTGKITDWSQVDGPPGPIHIFGRDSKSGTADTFNALVLAGSKPAGKMTITEGSEDMTLKILGDKGGIGYTGFAYLGDNKALNIGTECGLEFPPSNLLVRTEEYPLSRRLYLYAQSNPSNAQAREFINFALSDKGQELARKSNFIDLVPQIAPTQFSRDQIALGVVSLGDDRHLSDDDYDAFFDYARHVVNGMRISTTFRFQSNSAFPDARAVRDIDRLAEFLQSLTTLRRKVLVAGFSDSVGAPAANRALALKRAQTIATLLKSKGVSVAETVGYGQIVPVACNTNLDGQLKNRRVEIWLY